MKKGLTLSKTQTEVSHSYITTKCISHFSLSVLFQKQDVYINAIVIQFFIFIICIRLNATSCKSWRDKFVVQRVTQLLGLQKWCKDASVLLFFCEQVKTLCLWFNDTPLQNQSNFGQSVSLLTAFYNLQSFALWFLGWVRRHFFTKPQHSCRLRTGSTVCVFAVRWVFIGVFHCLRVSQLLLRLLGIILEDSQSEKVD